MPTLNFVKLKQGGTENDGFLSQRGEVAGLNSFTERMFCSCDLTGVGAGSSRTRSYGSASNQTSQVRKAAESTSFSG